MNPISMIAREAWHRWTGTLLALTAVAAAVTLYTGFHTTGAASDRETIRIMRDLGYNLRIIAEDADETAFWARGYAAATLPEDYVNRFAQAEGISFRHLLATVQRQIPFAGTTALFTGIAAKEVSPPGPKKTKMIYTIEPGTVYLGATIARETGLRPGARVDIGDESFKVARCLAEQGTEEDVRVYTDLDDAQRVLDMEGRINEIKALECLCQGAPDDMAGMLREQLAGILPDARVIELRAQAEIRQKQRKMSKAWFEFIMQFVVGVAAAWLAVLALLNVRERRREVGILRALGYRGEWIALLLLGKAVAAGVVAALVGFAAGTALALSVGPQIFQVTAAGIRAEYHLLFWALLVAPAFTALCALGPTIVALGRDPARTLSEE